MSFSQNKVTQKKISFVIVDVYIILIIFILAQMARAFLFLQWDNEIHGMQYNQAVKDLLKIWLENEPDPLSTVNSIMEWLPEQALALDRPQSRLIELPTVTKSNFALFLKQIFNCLNKGINISLENASR